MISLVLSLWRVAAMGTGSSGGVWCTVEIALWGVGCGCMDARMHGLGGFVCMYGSIERWAGLVLGHERVETLSGDVLLDTRLSKHVYTVVL